MRGGIALQGGEMDRARCPGTRTKRRDVVGVRVNGSHRVSPDTTKTSSFLPPVIDPTFCFLLHRLCLLLLCKTDSDV